MKRDCFKEFAFCFGAHKLKTEEIEKILTPEQRANIWYNGTFEPIDYMNVLNTYRMFLEYISVTNTEQQIDMDEEELKKKTDKEYLQLHLDFLKNDIKTKVLRYNVHDYIVRRIHR